MTKKEQIAILEQEAAIELYSLLKQADSFIIAIVNEENIRIRRSEDTLYHTVMRGEHERLFRGELPNAIALASSVITKTDLKERT